MKNFSEIELVEPLVRSLEKMKFVTPTKVQSKAIPQLLSGGDLMVCAETGSGKTAAYGIPTIQYLIENPGSRALVMAPTRELAQQIRDVFNELCSQSKKIKVVNLVGGADIRKQLNQLKRNPQIIVGTPGRIYDHIRRKSLTLDNAHIVVLDEGDRMLDMGFEPQIRDILKVTPKEKQSSLFTATLSNKVQSLAQKYLRKPKKLVVGTASKPVESIRQSRMLVKQGEKPELLADELNRREGSIIVFTRTKDRAEKVAKNLKSYGHQVDFIHGDRSQGQRNRAILRFKEGKSRILCATDVAARGIDVPSVEHVINFDLPRSDEDYVHRIGRTARNGADGEALSFVTPEEQWTWNILVNKYQIKGALFNNVEGKSKNKRSFKKNSSKKYSKPGRRKKSFKEDSGSGSGEKRFKRSKSRSEGKSADSSKPYKSKKSVKSNRDSDSGPSKRSAKDSRANSKASGAASSAPAKKKSSSRTAKPKTKMSQENFNSGLKKKSSSKKKSFSKAKSGSTKSGSEKGKSAKSGSGKGRPSKGGATKSRFKKSGPAKGRSGKKSSSGRRS